MIKGIAEFVGGKVLTAVTVVASIMVIIWFWRRPEDLQAIWHVVKVSAAWIGLAAVLPWGLFFLPPLVLRLESNLASAGLLAGYLLLDVLAAFWLAGWSIGGTLTWIVVILGFLAAGVYNFVVCDYLASRAEDL